MIWVGNVLHGIIKKKKKKLVKLKNPQCCLARLSTGWLSPCWEKRCTNYFYFPPLEGPILRRGGARPLGAGPALHAALDQAPQALYGPACTVLRVDVYCFALCSFIYLFILQKKRGRGVPFLHFFFFFNVSIILIGITFVSRRGGDL